MWILQSADATCRLKSGAIKTVGRAPRADFILDAALVSRLHCRLTAGESLESPGIYEIARGTRDARLCRRDDLEVEFASTPTS